MLLHIAAGGDTRAPVLFSTVFFAYFALELCEFSTVLLAFGVSEFFAAEATEVLESGSEMEAEGTTTDGTDFSDKDS